MSTSETTTDTLHPEDLADLRRSGLSDETIASMGCYSADADTIRLGTGVDKISSGGYSLPYTGISDQTGDPYVRWRLRHPTGKMRYASGRGDDPQLYIPPALASLPHADLLIVTEGEKKAAKAVQEGIPCVAVQGVWSWCDPDSRAAEKEEEDGISSETDPLAELMVLAKGYRRVLVLGDSDLLSNRQARQGFERLAKSLASRGVRTAVSFCPPLIVREGDDRKIRKQGLDDWLITKRNLAVRSLPLLFRAAEIIRDGITDNYNAIEFAEQFKDKIAFSQGLWRWWNGSIWTKDDCAKRRALVPSIANVYLSAVDDLNSLLSSVAAPYRDTKRDQWAPEILSWMAPLEFAIKDLRESAQGIRNLRGIDAALAIAQSYLRVADDVWDADPYLLGVRNGVVDLRSSELLPPSPQQWITRSAGAPYDPAATAESFLKFLDRVQPDAEIRKYLHRLAGYCAVGKSNEQKFIVFVGRGANGKSTYMGLLMAALGEYAVKGPHSLLAQQSPDRPRNDLAALAGARLASFSETPENLRLDEAMLKSMTGQDLISARFLHHEFFQFAPRFTPILDTNHPPRPKDTGESIWRRLDIVPWSVMIPTHEQDRNLSDDLLKELPGLLTWIIQGAKEYLDHGLSTPAKITKTSQALRLSCDDIGRWLENYVVQGTQFRVRCSDLYSSYASWSTDEGNSGSTSKKAFSTYLGSRGFTVRKSNGNSVCQGLRLRGPNDPQGPATAQPESRIVPTAKPGPMEVVLPEFPQHPFPLRSLERLPGGGYLI